MSRLRSHDLCEAVGNLLTVTMYLQDTCLRAQTTPLRGRGQHHCLWLLGRRVCGAVLLGSRAVWCRRWSRQLWRPLRRRRSTLLLCPSSWRSRWRRSSRRKKRLRSRRRWRSWRRRWLRLKTSFRSSFSGNGRRGPGSLVRPGPHSPASSSSPCTSSWPGMRWRRRRVSGRKRRRGGGGVQNVVILGDDGASLFDCGYMHGFRTRILRSILVLLSCSVFAAFGAALVSTTALVCLGWFCWCRRTSRYIPFFCFRIQRIACPQWYMLCFSLRNFLFFYVNMWITDPVVDS